MSLRKAREMFADGVRYVDPKKDPATHDLIAGLFQLVNGLQAQLDQLQHDVGHVSRQVAELANRR